MNSTNMDEDNITKLYNEDCVIAKKLLNYTKELLESDIKYKKLDKSKLYEYIQQNIEYKLFIQKYPITSKNIIYKQEFNNKAFKKHVKLAYDNIKLKETQEQKRVKEEHIARMCNEGIDMAKKLLKYVKHLHNTDLDFKELDKSKKNNYIQKKDEFKTFIQMYPVVSTYIIHEHMFNDKAFTKYVKIVYGYEKTNEDRIYIMENKRNIYYFKNKQYAYYSQFLIAETNKHMTTKELNKVYDDMLNQLDETTKKNFELYDKSLEKVNAEDAAFTEEKKNELINLLKSKLI